jgi:hypothetical protein
MFQTLALSPFWVFQRVKTGEDIESQVDVTVHIAKILQERTETCTIPRMHSEKVDLE